MEVFIETSMTKQTWGLMGVPGGVLGGSEISQYLDLKHFLTVDGNISIVEWTLLILVDDVHQKIWFYPLGVPFFVSKSLNIPNIFHISKNFTWFSISDLSFTNIVIVILRKFSGTKFFSLVSFCFLIAVAQSSFDSILWSCYVIVGFGYHYILESNEDRTTVIKQTNFKKNLEFRPR